MKALFFTGLAVGVVITWGSSYLFEGATVRAFAVWYFCFACIVLISISKQPDKGGSNKS